MELAFGEKSVELCRQEKRGTSSVIKKTFLALNAGALHVSDAAICSAISVMSVVSAR